MPPAIGGLVRRALAMGDAEGEGGGSGAPITASGPMSWTGWLSGAIGIPHILESSRMVGLGRMARDLSVGAALDPQLQRLAHLSTRCRRGREAREPPAFTFWHLGHPHHRLLQEPARMPSGHSRDPPAFIPSNTVGERMSDIGALDDGGNALSIALGDTISSILRAERSRHTNSIPCSRSVRDFLRDIHH